MKKYILILLFGCFVEAGFSQTTSTTLTTSGTISSLAVPTSPAFSITDITPSLVQNPTTPKAFVLGVAQSFQQSGTGFPNNYSAEFAPVWWINPKSINIYSYLGLPVPSKDVKERTNENIFAGVKFTTISVAFINKDLIPDTSKSTQNIFSIGVHTTLIKVYGNKHSDTLAKYIDQWEKDANKELDIDDSDLIDKISKLGPKPKPTDTPATKTYNDQVKAILENWKEVHTAADLAVINKLIDQKPCFSWDLAGAWAEYGINNNQQTKTGRAGVWTSLSSYLPFKHSTTNYFNINLLGRYLLDNFQQNAQGIIGKANNIDIGGNLGFDFNKLSVAVESLYRFVNGVPNTENRTVGVISVKLTDKIFINGTFGKDFAGPNKLISAFGINWGFGNEKVSLP